MLGNLLEPGLFTIVRHNPAERGPLGRPTSTEASRTTTAGRLEQTGSKEGEGLVVDLFRAVFPKGTDVRSGDTVESRGLVYTVQGEPSREGVPGFPAIGLVLAVLRYVGPVTS